MQHPIATLTKTMTSDEDWPKPRSRIAIAWNDIMTALQQPWMWGALAMQDVRLRYRGSVLGPFWLTLSTLIMVVAMGVIYSRLFNQSPNEYIPYLLLGMVFWQFLVSIINDGCQTFLAVEGIIQQIALPFSLHALRVICKNYIALAHNAILIPFGMFIFDTPVNWYTLTVVPALFVLSINAFFVCLLLGALSARFRDIPPIINNFIQVLFFVTPIFWSIDALGRWKSVALFNPLFAAIDIVRAPLLGKAPEPTSWLIIIAVTILFGLTSFLLFARFRSRIAYWI